MKALLVIGVLLVVFVAACGEVHVDVWSADKSTPATSVGTSYTGGTSHLTATPAGLGGGTRTATDARWINRMTLLCARRNRREDSLPRPDDTMFSLARYSAQTLWVWDDYERRAASLRVPATYTREASWVKQVDSSRRQAIQTVLNFASTRNEAAAHSALNAFQNLSRGVYPGLAKIGLTTCT